MNKIRQSVQALTRSTHTNVQRHTDGSPKSTFSYLGKGAENVYIRHSLKIDFFTITILSYTTNIRK
jgi:hypothetical protein